MLASQCATPLGTTCVCISELQRTRQWERKRGEEYKKRSLLCSLTTISYFFSGIIIIFACFIEACRIYYIVSMCTHEHKARVWPKVIQILHLCIKLLNSFCCAQRNADPCALWWGFEPRIYMVWWTLCKQFYICTYADLRRKIKARERNNNSKKCSNKQRKIGFCFRMAYNGNEFQIK